MDAMVHNVDLDDDDEILGLLVADPMEVEDDHLVRQRIASIPESGEVDDDMGVADSASSQPADTVEAAPAPPVKAAPEPAPPTKAAPEPAPPPKKAPAAPAPWNTGRPAVPGSFRSPPRPTSAETAPANPAKKRAAPDASRLAAPAAAKEPPQAAAARNTAAPAAPAPAAAQEPRERRFFRRQGMPCNIFVERSGDLYTVCANVSRAMWRERMCEVLALRHAKLRELGKSLTDSLDAGPRQEVIRTLKEAWKARQGEELRIVWERSRTYDIFNRAVSSRFQAYCYQIFGGMQWLQIFVALGCIPNRVVIYVNQHIAYVLAREKTGRNPSFYPTEGIPGPRLSERNAAIASGVAPEDAPPIRGVQHKVAESNKLRKHYKRTKKAYEAAVASWEAGRGPWLSFSKWQRWQREVEDLHH